MNTELTSDVSSRAARHAALGDPTRLRIVDLLAESDASPGEVANPPGSRVEPRGPPPANPGNSRAVRRKSSDADGRRSLLATRARRTAERSAAPARKRRSRRLRMHREHGPIPDRTCPVERPQHHPRRVRRHPTGDRHRSAGAHHDRAPRPDAGRPPAPTPRRDRRRRRPDRHGLRPGPRVDGRAADLHWSIPDPVARRHPQGVRSRATPSSKPASAELSPHLIAS